MNLKIFYFSGTGNAERVATWIDNYAFQNQITSEITNISKTEIKDIKIDSNNLLGFISPTHGFNFPPIMIRFLLNFPKTNKKTNVFIINTRAGMKLAKLFLPGLSGATLLFSAIILKIKGYRIVGLRSIDLPSNWISLHPGLKEKVVISIHQRCKRITESFAKIIFSGRKNYSALYEIPIDLLLIPISLGYYFIGRFILAKTFYASSTCDNCMICIEHCPVKAIKLIQKRPFWSYRCESCMKCINNCPKRSIETAHGYIIGAIILFYTTILFFIYNYLTGDVIEEILANSIIRVIFESIFLFLFIIISYRIVHYLRRFKLVDWIIINTSLTKYKFWRRYHLPKIKS